MSGAIHIKQYAFHARLSKVQRPTRQQEKLPQVPFPVMHHGRRKGAEQVTHRSGYCPASGCIVIYALSSHPRFAHMCMYMHIPRCNMQACCCCHACTGR